MIDKVLHVAAGAAIGWAGAYFFGPIQGVALATGIGLAKEVMDWYFGGTFDAWDAAATAAGGVAVVLLM